MRLCLCAALAALIAQPVQAQEARTVESGATGLSLSTGVDYSTGDYGTPQDTEIWVIPFSARLKTGSWRFTAALPWLRISGASSILGGGAGGPIIIDPTAPRTRRSGIGDLTLGATFSALTEDKAGLNLDLAGRVKLPTASTGKGLGTGKVDVAISADISKTFGAATPFVTIGYRMPGDPATFNLRNAFSASAGTSIAFGRTVAILSYDYRESTSARARDGHELFGALSGPIGERFNWTLYGTAGLSKGSPDVGTGLMLTARLF